jgi:hypothetical protein
MAQAPAIKVGLTDELSAALQSATTKLRLIGIGLEVLEEIERAVAKHGPQTHPDGTGEGQGRRVVDELGDRLFADPHSAAADFARIRCDKGAARGPEHDTWEHILTEEFFEALEESEWVHLRGELVQVAAMAMAWIADGDARSKADD